MLLEDVIGAVLLRISGGKVTADLSVHPSDVKPYVPDAVNMLMGVRIDKEYGEEAAAYPNGLFVNVYENLPIATNGRNLKYVTFPVRPLTTRGARSVVAVGEMGGRPFTRIYHDEGTLGAFYWKTRTDVTTYDVEGSTAVLYNVPDTVADIYAKLVVHIDALGDTDEIFVPSGMETELVNIIVEMMMAQRATPKDSIVDGKDGAQ